MGGIRPTSEREAVAMEESRAHRGFEGHAVPPAGEHVEVLCRYESAIRPLPFLCCWTSDDGWVFAGSRRKVTYEILGWRRRKRRV